MNEMDFYKQVTSFCSFIGDVHSGVIPSKDYLKYEKDSLKKLPFKFDIVNKRLYILENYSDYNSIIPGCEILSINNKPALDIINEIITHIASDGYNLTYKYHYLAKHLGRYYTRIIGSPDIYNSEIVNYNKQNTNTITVNAKRDNEILIIKQQKYPSENSPALDFKVINNQISYLRSKPSA